MKLIPAILSILLAGASAAGAADRDLPISSIRVPAGFRVELFSDAVPGARSMAQGPSGILFVGTRDQGVVYALVDRDADGKAEKVVTIAKGLNSPNGVAFRNGSLFVAEISRVIRFDRIAEWVLG